MTGPTRRDNDLSSEEDIRQLLSLAGPRRQPPKDLEARVRAATLAAVAELPEQDRSTRRNWRAARLPIAAALLISLLAGYLLLPTTDGVPAGNIVYSSGSYSVRGSELAGGSLAAGAIVRTSSSGRLLVDLGEGRTLRIDHDSSLTLHDDSEVWLHRGRVYLDSAGGIPLTIITPYASVSDIGTQFEVVVDDELLLVATREGTVRVALGSKELVSKAVPGSGESLQIDGLELLGRADIPTSGDRWSWIQKARPLFDVQDRSIRDYLEWASREEGKQLRFTTPLAAQQADLRTLYSTSKVDSDSVTLRRVLATSAFETVPGEEHEIVVALRAQE